MRFLTKAHQEVYNISFVSKLILQAGWGRNTSETLKNKVLVIKEVSLCCQITRYGGQAQSKLTMKLYDCLSSNALLVVILRENNSFYLSLEAVNIA